MASVVMDMGRGGAAWAKRELGWDRTIVRKGMHELESCVVCFDNVGLRGRKGFATKLPQLQDDFHAIADAFKELDFWRPQLPPGKTSRSWLVYGGDSAQLRENVTVLPWHGLAPLLQEL